MKLFYTSSVCSLAVRIILNELKIPYEYEAVDLKTKQTESGKDFLKINPKGSVPVLQITDGLLLTENSVILQYLSDKYPKKGLLPPVNNISRYRTLEWLNFVSTDLHRYCAPLFWSKIPLDLKDNLFMPILSSKLSVIEVHLKGNIYLMGDQFTLADAYLLVILIWLSKLQKDLHEWPNLSRYYSHIKDRDSVRLALEQENLTHL